jgi:hypothetical protein
VCLQALTILASASGSRPSSGRAGRPSSPAPLAPG